MWTAVIVTAIGCYLLKLAGLSVPDTVLDRPVVRRIADLIPVALLGALVAVQAFSTAQELVVDARLVGVGAAWWHWRPERRSWWSCSWPPPRLPLSGWLSDHLTTGLPCKQS